MNLLTPHDETCCLATGPENEFRGVDVIVPWLVRVEAEEVKVALVELQVIGDRGEIAGLSLVVANPRQRVKGNHPDGSKDTMKEHGERPLGKHRSIQKFRRDNWQLHPAKTTSLKCSTAPRAGKLS